MPIMKFSTDEEVVILANDSRYGLGCAVFSGSQRRAKQIASQIHCGVAAINDFASSYMCQVMLHLSTLISTIFPVLLLFVPKIILVFISIFFLCCSPFHLVV